MDGAGRIDRRIRLAVQVCAVLALAGCGRAPASAGAEDADATAIFTRADDLPVFTLEPVTPFEQDDFELAGDKRCSFSTHPAQPPLLLATGFLRQPGREVDVLTKYGGQVVEGRLVTPGGFDAIRQEAAFETSGVVIDIARIAVEPDGSGPAAPGRALLRMTMAGQEQQIIEGYWLCTL